MGIIFVLLHKKICSEKKKGFYLQRNVEIISLSWFNIPLENIIILLIFKSSLN